ncbi:MAG TPA: MmcQ/YjbR family DNA-binding protein [Microlunatus sp.]
MAAYSRADVARALGMVRSASLALPETSERLSHGGPAFFIRDKKCFVMFLDDHHDDGRLAIWCAAPDGVQAEMVDTEPDRFFRPPYVGHRGWLGVQLLEFGQDELAAIVLDAYRTVAPPTLVHRLPSAERAQDVR